MHKPMLRLLDQHGKSAPSSLNGRSGTHPASQLDKEISAPTVLNSSLHSHDRWSRGYGPQTVI